MMANPWAALMTQVPAKLNPAVKSTTSAAKAPAPAPVEEKGDEEENPAKEVASVVEDKAERPATPKTPRRQNAEPSPFTPTAAAIFISPHGPEFPGSPIHAFLRPDAAFIPNPFFPSPELLRLAKPPTAPEEVDPSTIFSLPPPPYSHAKPPSSYAALIGQAINASHRKRACLDHIYLFISTVYPYYKRGEQAWQNSVRHNLSQNSSFTRLKHPSGGQHGEWGIREEDKHCFANGGFNKSARPPEPGRKRRRKGAFDDDTDLEEDITSRKKSRKLDRSAEELQDAMTTVLCEDLITQMHPSDSRVEGEDVTMFHLPSRREIMSQAKTAQSPMATEKKPAAVVRKTGGKSRARAKKKKPTSELEDLDSDDDDDFAFDVGSPLHGRGKKLSRASSLRSLPAPLPRRKDPDEELAAIDALLQCETTSSKAPSASPPLESAPSEMPSEPTSDLEVDDDSRSVKKEEDDGASTIGRSSRPQDFMERTIMEREKSREAAVKRRERLKPVPKSTLLNLSPMRRFSASPMKSAVRGSAVRGPSTSRTLDDVMSRFPANSDARDEDSMSGEDFSHGPDRELEEDERDRSVTPPPLIPNPPWIDSPALATPGKGPHPDDDDSDRLLAQPLFKKPSLCISPNSSHLHQQQLTFMTPARAIGDPNRPFDNSFPTLPRISSPTRTLAAFEPVTPDRASSNFRSIFLQTPVFSSSFSEGRLEDELNRMSRGEDSPNGFFRRSDLYKSPSVPGSSPHRGY
ncbi:hypothetical protein FRC19_004732 [Serendipita sp. 401]|nr:hypothetical protein FRC19_004732 [Serendipita sp. 401]